MKKLKLPRVFYPWWDWECYRAGFWNTVPPEGMDADQCREQYRLFLSDLGRFGRAMERVIKEWPKSCEHFLTNPSLNKIAWFGQASLCIDTGIPSHFRSGFQLLTPEQQEAANQLAAEYVERWTTAYVNSHQSA